MIGLSTIRVRSTPTERVVLLSGWRNWLRCCDERPGRREFAALDEKEDNENDHVRCFRCDGNTGV